MKNVSIVAEGGGTKIAYTAGVLKCLLEEEIYVPYCVGISAGAEILLPYVSRQIRRLEVTGIDAPSQKGAVGLSALMKEGSVFGIESTNNFIQSKTPLDFETFYNSSTQMDTGLYNIKEHTIEYFDKSYVDQSMTLIKASCALLLLTKPYEFQGKKYFDAGLVDMISIKQAEKHGCEKHIIISTKEEGYVRKPAPAYQRWLTQLVYKDKKIAEDLRYRHERYAQQWDRIAELEKEGKALVLRPHKDLGVTRYTKDPKKLKPWFQLGYDETKARIDEIKSFCGIE